MKELNWGHFSEAYNVYRELTSSPYNYNTTLRFVKFIGLREKEYKRIWANSVRLLPEKCHPRIRGLLSPHARTLFKAWEAIDDANREKPDGS